MKEARNERGLEGLALEEAAECLRTLAHPHRLKIVEMLLNKRVTVGELARACGISSSLASEHLRLMKDRGLLGSERVGRRIYYRIAEPHLADIMRCVKARFGTSEVEEVKKQ